MDALRSTNILRVEIPPSAGFVASPQVAELQKRCGASGCKRRLLLSDMACRCGYKFCTAHRHAEDHECLFDYKDAATKQLASTLVKCVAAKL